MRILLAPLVTLAAIAATSTVGAADGVAAEQAYRQAIAGAVEGVEARVVQLRYFGEGQGDALGSAAAPVSGWLLDDPAWVLSSTYGLDTVPAAIVCRLPDGERAEATLVARDTNRRVALLRIGAPGRADQPPRVDGRRPRVGETAVAVGRVYSADAVNISVGVVSALDRLGGRALQTDAAVSPANYGGVLIGLDGALLGLVTPLAPPGQSGVGLYDSGVGFAVPFEAIEARLPRLAKGEDLHPGRLGVSISQEAPLRSPAVIAKVIEGGPAARAGMAEGDTIVSLAGRPTPTAWRLRAVLGGLDAGERVEVDAERDGERRRFTVTLRKRGPAEGGPNQQKNKRKPTEPTAPAQDGRASNKKTPGES